jgi:protein gp37
MTQISYMNPPGFKGENWNPWIGCTKCSPGCENCWAGKYENQRRECRYTLGRDFFHGPICQGDSVLEKPLHWKKRRFVFLCPRSDWMHDEIDEAEADAMVAMMAVSARHVFYTSTKRAKELAGYWTDPCLRLRISDLIRQRRGYDDLSPNWPPPNIIHAVTVCNQSEAWKIGELMKVPSACRVISREPALGPVEWEPWMPEIQCGPLAWGHDGVRQDTARPGIDWLIMGGESGPNARPMHPDWARAARDACAAAGVPYYFKQWGEWVDWWHAPFVGDFDAEPGDLVAQGNEICRTRRHRPGSGPDSSGWLLAKALPCVQVDGKEMFRVGKKIAGRLLDGREWSELPKILNRKAAK